MPISSFFVDWTAVQTFLGPLLWIVGSYSLGWLLERALLVRLARWAEKTSWEGDDLLVNGLRGLVRVAGLLLGIHAALVQWDFPPKADMTLHRGLVILAVMSASLFAARIAEGFVRLYTRSVEGVMPTTSIFYSLTRLAVLGIGVLIALQSVGISITPILTALGVGGLATALALQPTLSNLFSAIQILASRCINPGDFVRLDSGEEGYVQDITWRTTTLRSLAGSLILIPNSKLANAVVTNHWFPDKEISIGVPCCVAYGSDLTKVEAIVAEVGKEVQQTLAGAIENFEPSACFSAFGDSGLHLSVGLRAKEYVDQYQLRHEFIKRLDARFRKEGIVVPLPQRVNHAAAPV